MTLLLGYWGGRGSRSLNFREMLLTGDGERRKGLFRVFQKRNCISKGEAVGNSRTHLEKGERIGVVAPKCMLGGNIGGVDNREPRRQSGPQVHAGRECWQV